MRYGETRKAKRHSRNEGLSHDGGKNASTSLLRSTARPQPASRSIKHTQYREQCVENLITALLDTSSVGITEQQTTSQHFLGVHGPQHNTEERHHHHPSSLGLAFHMLAGVPLRCSWRIFHQLPAIPKSSVLQYRYLHLLQALPHLPLLFRQFTAMVNLLVNYQGSAACK